MDSKFDRDLLIVQTYKCVTNVFPSLCLSNNSNFIATQFVKHYAIVTFFTF